MVDLNTCPPTPPMGENSKIKKLMGRTPGILKTKFLTVLGNSNELLNGISNKVKEIISVFVFFRHEYSQPHLLAAPLINLLLRM